MANIRYSHVCRIAAPLENNTKNIVKIRAASQIAGDNSTLRLLYNLFINNEKYENSPKWRGLHSYF